MAHVTIIWVDARAAGREISGTTGREALLWQWEPYHVPGEAPRVVAGVGGRRGRKGRRARWARAVSMMRHWLKQESHPCVHRDFDGVRRLLRGALREGAAAPTPIGRRERRRLQRHVRRERDRLVREARGGRGAPCDPWRRAQAIAHARYWGDRGLADGLNGALLAWVDGGRPRSAAQARAWRQAERRAHTLADMDDSRHAGAYGSGS